MIGFLLIGLVVGVALALTGGGGAIIGIPLMVHWGALLWILAAAFPATLAFAMLKPLIPITVIQALLILIAVWGLITVWRPRPSKALSSETNRLSAIGIGIVSGAMTSITGLGGGLLMFPVLRRFLSLSEPASTATSLAIVVFNAVISFGLQSRVVSLEGMGWSTVAALVFGFVLANAMVHLIRLACTQQCHCRVVKSVYTLILFTSITLLLFPPH